MQLSHLNVCLCDFTPPAVLKEWNALRAEVVAHDAAWEKIEAARKAAKTATAGKKVDAEKLARDLGDVPDTERRLILQAPSLWRRFARICGAVDTACGREAKKRLAAAMARREEVRAKLAEMGVSHRAIAYAVADDPAARNLERDSYAISRIVSNWLSGTAYDEAEADFRNASILTGAPMPNVAAELVADFEEGAGS